LGQLYLYLFSARLLSSRSLSSRLKLCPCDNETAQQQTRPPTTTPTK
jgi:hypothetical protein